MAYRLANSLATLRAECNARWPGRDKASDGWIGDPAHKSRSSDHNPWVKDSRGVGVVRAFDVDAGPGLNREIGLFVAEHVRSLGKRDFLPLSAGAYVISASRIADKSSNWNWVKYNGVNPHTKHTHISVATSQSYYDSTASWGIARANVLPAPPAGGGLKLGDSGAAVKALQAVLNAWYPDLAKLTVDGQFGQATEQRVRYFQTRAGLVSDGVVGPKTKAGLGL